ncbi:MAG: choice-of-anchor R domain-containing protein [Pirellulales bacterium]
MFRRAAVIATSLCLVFLVAETALAEIVYNTFRDDGGFSSNYGYFIHPGEPLGARFLVPGSDRVRLQAIAIGAKATNGSPASARVTLRENTASNNPGAILDAIARNDIASNAQTNAAGTYLFMSVSKPLLQPGTPYWVVVENSGSDSVRLFWFANAVGVRDPVVEVQQGSWYHYNPDSAPTPALYVEVTPVPEPSTLALLATGATGLLNCVWRRRQARRQRYLTNDAA